MDCARNANLLVGIDKNCLHWPQPKMDAVIQLVDNAWQVLHDQVVTNIHNGDVEALQTVLRQSNQFRLNAAYELGARATPNFLSTVCSRLEVKALCNHIIGGALVEGNVDMLWSLSNAGYTEHIMKVVRGERGTEGFLNSHYKAGTVRLLLKSLKFRNMDQFIARAVNNPKYNNFDPDVVGVLLDYGIVPRKLVLHNRDAIMRSLDSLEE